MKFYRTLKNSSGDSVPRYCITYGYDQKDVVNFMKVFHEYDSKTGSFRPFDFTLTTFWGEAAENAGYASTRKYGLWENGNLIGLFQGLIRKKLFYKSLVAGSTSGNGIAMVPDFSSGMIRLFLLKILKREKPSAFSIFSPISLNLSSFSERANYTLYINLDLGVEEIFQNMRKKTRNRVKKARKSGVTVDFSNSIKDLREAYNVIYSTSTLRSIPALPWRYIVKLHDCFQGNGCKSMVALGYVQGETVLSAAHLIGFDKKLVLWQAGSTEKGYKLNVGSLLQAEVIEHSKNLGYLIYDMGGTDPKNPIYAGIHRFKSGFGGSLIANIVIQKNAFYIPFVLRAYNLFKSKNRVIASNSW